MGLRGPAPKPTALQRLEGNPGKRKLPINEPEYDLGLPLMPEHISAGAREVWDELIAEMAGAAVLRRVDKRALWHLAEDEALLEQVYRGVWEMAELLKKKAAAENKTLPGNAIFALMQLSSGRAAMRSIRDLAGRTILERREFGLTPSSRSRISTAAEAAGADALEMKLCG